jgi:hypothetical protein
MLGAVFCTQSAKQESNSTYNFFLLGPCRDVIGEKSQMPGGITGLPCSKIISGHKFQSELDTNTY